MFAIKIAEFGSIALVMVIGLLIIFQIIVPAITQTPFFPMLRSKPREAANKYAEAVEARGVLDVEKATKAILPMGKDSSDTKQRKGK